MKTIPAILRVRRNTFELWQEANPVLREGEIGLVLHTSKIDPGKIKTGDGVTSWNNLPYTIGADGKAATINILGIDTLQPDEQAEVINVGNENAASLIFRIPKGDKGDGVPVYNPKSRYCLGDFCYLINGTIYSKYVRISDDPEFITNIPPSDTDHWSLLTDEVEDIYINHESLKAFMKDRRQAEVSLQYRITSGLKHLSDRIDVLEEFAEAGGFEPPPIPDPPTVSAGNNQTITMPVSSVLLSANASSDGGIIISQLWELVSGPNNPTISSPTSISTQVTGLIIGSYVFKFTVIDNYDQESFDDLTITVNAGNPTANAGNNQTITFPTASVTLNGSGLSPNGSIVSYAWSRISGTGVIANTGSATTSVSFTTSGANVFRLTVTDNVNKTATSNVTVTVNPHPYTIREFEANGNFVVPFGITQIRVTACAAGGGGGTCGASSNKTGGGGGGGGQAILNQLFTVSANQNIAITIGTGGGNETVGGNTVIGSLITLTGGRGGLIANNSSGGSQGGAAGGTGGGGGGKSGGYHMPSESVVYLNGVAGSPGISGTGGVGGNAVQGVSAASGGGGGGGSIGNGGSGGNHNATGGNGSRGGGGGGTGGNGPGSSAGRGGNGYVKIEFGY